MLKALSSTRTHLTKVFSLGVIAIASAISIGQLPSQGSVWGIAIPFSALSFSSVLLIFLLHQTTAQRHYRQQSDELQRKIRRLEESNRWLKLTEANAHVGHWRLDLRTDEVFWSDETFRIHGLEPGEPPNLTDAIKFFHPDDRLIVEESVETARTTGEPFTFRARLLRSDGDIRHTESIALLEYKNGKPATLFGVFADRSEEEAMREALREARDDARAMAQAKSTFLTKMSHEIRTPMNGVLGFVDLLLASDLSPTQQRHARLIAESGRNLQTLLNDILDMSRIEAGRLQVHAKPTELEDLLRSAVALVEPNTREKGLQLLCDFDPELPQTLLVDPLRLRQIVNNLLANAVRFTDKGRIALTARRDGGRLAITVSDSGIGIDDTLFDSIFDAFTTINHAELHGRGGTGLGLGICRQLAELMGGTIAVDSEPGLGSRFTVTLPLIKPTEDAPAAESASTPTADRASHWPDVPILLAEDYDINRELVAEMAKRLDLKLDQAEDGAEAVAMVRRADRDGRPYGLVLMDLQMPVMDGLAATRVIREAGFDPVDLPILALTANAFAEDIAASKAAGMQAHLTKPFSFQAFHEAIDHWLTSPSARAA